MQLTVDQCDKSDKELWKKCHNKVSQDFCRENFFHSFKNFIVNIKQVKNSQMGAD